MNIINAPPLMSLWIGEWQSEIIPTIRGTIKVFLKEYSENIDYQSVGILEFTGCYKPGHVEIIHPDIRVCVCDDKHGLCKADSRELQCHLLSINDDHTHVRAGYTTSIPHYDKGVVELTKSLFTQIEYTPSNNSCSIL